MIRLPSIRTVVAFEAVVRHGSFGKAAAELNLTISAVSHQIAGLEEYVGRRLFTRSPRGVSLTAAGERYQKSLSGALAIIADATESARLGADSEILRIHSAPTFASQWLMPRLPSFMTEHPEIRIRLAASPGASDFSRDEIDVDIRYGVARWPSLHAEALFAEEIMPMISPRLKERLDIATPEDLLMQDLIYCEPNTVQWSQWFAGNGISVCPSQYALRVDRAGIGLEAAAGGLGIVLDSHILAEQYLANGRLVPVFADRKSLSIHQHHLVYPSQNSKRSALLKFSSWLRAEAVNARNMNR